MNQAVHNIILSYWSPSKAVAEQRALALRYKIAKAAVVLIQKDGIDDGNLAINSILEFNLPEMKRLAKWHDIHYMIQRVPIDIDWCYSYKHIFRDHY